MEAYFQSGIQGGGFEEPWDTSSVSSSEAGDTDDDLSETGSDADYDSEPEGEYEDEYGTGEYWNGNRDVSAYDQYHGSQSPHVDVEGDSSSESGESESEDEVGASSGAVGYDNSYDVEPPLSYGVEQPNVYDGYNHEDEAGSDEDGDDEGEEQDSDSDEDDGDDDEDHGDDDEDDGDDDEEGEDEGTYH